MSINPLTNTLAGMLGAIQRPATGTEGARTRVDQDTARPVANPAANAPARAQMASIAQPTQSSLPVSAPPGTDPELWSVLTGEERAFFARVGTMGPLTYGRMTSPPAASPSMRGGRLDVKA
jgi:hypothetical protein